mmetsp:Transcript_35573/g.92937  ORF Transcript_35573/g.92937 Transcript_35573/m.92937 type:complete len:220 (-) Transcript_35573:165-824(-)
MEAVHEYLLQVLLKLLQLASAEHERREPAPEANRLPHNLRVELHVGFPQLLPQLRLLLQVLHDLVEDQEVLAEHLGVERADLGLPLQEEALNCKKLAPEQAEVVRKAGLEAHEYGDPIAEDAEQKARRRHEDLPAGRPQLVEHDELYDPRDEAHRCSAMLYEPELGLPQHHEKSIEQLLLLCEHLDDHAVVVDAELLVAQQLQDSVPKIRALLHYEIKR